jgi:copper oxidase (laccase) domain-containing protein
MVAPTATFFPFGNSVEIRLFGRKDQETGEITDWSPAKLDDARRQRLATIAADIGVRQLAAPRPTLSNAKICTVAELNEPIDCGQRISLRRGCDADGTVVIPAQPFFMASADCTTIVVRDAESGHVIAAHGGRDSLFDRQRILTGRVSRPHESVVDAIIEHFRVQFKSSCKALQVYLTCGIHPRHYYHSFDHPTFGEQNRKICMHLVEHWGRGILYGTPEEGRLSIGGIITAQFFRHGIKPTDVDFDSIDTYGDIDETADYRWWSNRRGDTTQRNGVLVIRRS